MFEVSCLCPVCSVRSLSDVGSVGVRNPFDGVRSMKARGAQGLKTTPTCDPWLLFWVENAAQCCGGRGN